jgi:alkanesulfonate monooxygenase SsuD/methylene tetrahydromethanopterin reductase-like flavin-dependent oxidoreductase (luciferase family)
MRFGIFYEHQLPRPWTEGLEQKLFQDALDQVELADRLGFDNVWEVEHHFLEEYSHSSAPEVFLAACSQRTKQIRLGHGIVLMPPGYNHPARVAERIATLDLVSNGRVEFGTGESSALLELGGYGVGVADKRNAWREAVEQCANMLAMDPYPGFEGEFFSMPCRNVMPKPVQRPHPPLWVACSNIQTIGNAGEWGMGALGFSFVSPDAARAWVHKYYNTLLHRSKPLCDYPRNPNVAIVNGFMCAPTDEEAIAKAAGWTFFIFALSYYGRKGVDAPGTSDLWREYQDWRGTEKAQAALQSGLIGSPATIRARLRQFETAHVDQVILLNQAGRTSHQDICDSLQLFAAEVMPEFHARQPEQEAWKADVLAGRTVLEDLDTERYDLYAHQNEDIVRLTPQQLKERMAAKEARQGGD